MPALPMTTALKHALALALCLPALMGAGAQTPDRPSGDPVVAAGIDAYNRGDIPRAYRLLRERADAGDSDAQVNLGYMYARGDGVAPNQAEALRLYQLSAAQNNGEGMNAIGYKYDFGSGVVPDPDRAVYWFCAAIARGNPRALNNLAWLHMQGKGVPRDPVEARALWLQSAERAHVNGMYSLGLSLLSPEGGPPDPAQAIVWLTRAAERGQVAAQRALERFGVRRPWPLALDHLRIMELQPRDAPPGRAKVCAALIS